MPCWRLILNAVILIACLSYFDAVLTLPGIAGVILTIGMAVDSNVLIFERIREELRAGKAVRAAVDTGFDKALLTIIDTHVTTVVSCAILFLLGSGPVKGICGHAGDWPGGEHIYGRVRFEDDFRLGTLPAEAGDAAQYLNDARQIMLVSVDAVYRMLLGTLCDMPVSI